MEAEYLKKCILDCGADEVGIVAVQDAFFCRSSGKFVKATAAVCMGAAGCVLLPLERLKL